MAPTSWRLMMAAVTAWTALCVPVSSAGCVCRRSLMCTTSGIPARSLTVLSQYGESFAAYRKSSTTTNYHVHSWFQWVFNTEIPLWWEYLHHTIPTRAWQLHQLQQSKNFCYLSIIYCMYTEYCISWNVKNFPPTEWIEDLICSGVQMNSILTHYVF